MRVLYVMDNLAASGAETSLLLMVPGLVRAGVDLHYAFFRDQGGPAAAFEEGGARLHRLEWGSGRRDRAEQVRDVTRRLSPDLVHTTLFESDLAGRVGGRLARARVVSSLVNIAYGEEHRTESNLPKVKLAMAHAADAASAQLVHRFHAISQAVADTMGRRLLIPRSRIEVIYRGRSDEGMGRPSPERRAAVRARLGLDERTPVVLAAGRQEAQKGFDLLLPAVARLREQVPGVQVLVAGREGNQTAALTAQRKQLGLEGTVQLLGHRDDVADLMVAADCFVLTSRREGIAGVVIEAMALECPVVANDLDVIREVVTGSASSASLTDAGDPAALADAMERVLADPAYAGELRRLGRERFTSTFTIEAVVGQMVGFYERAAA